MQQPVLCVCLPCTQELLLQGSVCTADSFKALPDSLTKLQIDSTHLKEEPDLFLGPSSTPGLTQLSALQWLEVSYAAEFDVDLLDSLRSLQHLAVKHSMLTTADDGPGLAVLSSLTDLRHLELPAGSDQDLVAATAAAVAALTASSQLTFLDLQGRVSHEDYFKLFPETTVPGELFEFILPDVRPVPELRVLRATMGLLCDRAAVNMLVEWCPQLQAIDLSVSIPGEPSADLEPQILYEPEHTVGILRGLKHLTSLQLDLSAQVFPQLAWDNLVTLTNLQDLTLKAVPWEFFGGVVSLTSCRQLTQLKVILEMGRG